MVSQQPTDHHHPCRRAARRVCRRQQRAQLLEFAERYRAADAGNSKLVIAVPSGSPNEVAAMRGRRRDPVADCRSRASPNRDRGRALSRGARRRRADPRLLPALRRRAARVRTLVDQSCRRSAITCRYPNFGCAQQHNLAAMIANPADLLGPRTMEPARPRAPRRGVRQVREGRGHWRAEEPKTSVRSTKGTN